MSKALTSEQLINYRANGFLYPFDALSADEVARYREALRATESRLGGLLMEIDRKYRGNLHFMCRWVDELIHHPKILGVIEDVIGPDILLYTQPRVRHVGPQRMPACLVRGTDTYGHFDLQPRPQQDFGAAETQRHEVSFKAYVDSFYEQLALVEKDIPAGATAFMN